MTTCGWTTSADNNLICRFQASNLTKGDAKRCVGDATRAVIDVGASYSGVMGFRARVGEVEENYFRGQKPVCDSVPPLSTVQMTIEFFRSRGQDEKLVQFLRVGGGRMYLRCVQYPDQVTAPSLRRIDLNAGLPRRSTLSRPRPSPARPWRYETFVKADH